MKNLTNFMQLFRPLPGNRYIQVTTKPDNTTIALDELLQSVGGTLRLALYTDENHETNVETQYIKELTQTFRALPREHDKVILKDIYAIHENQTQLLKTAYTTLANTAEIIIMEKKGLLPYEELYDALITCEYRTPNQIDILEDYDIIVAKKMHMWGNGL
ncbi:MAG: hypothetical protein RBR59_03240 [Sulfurimonadaceae bacterium]|jgi:hypothetical protein|nr:hypothetical protein [Sulfurimonadaceae bacterium]